MAMSIGPLAALGFGAVVAMLLAPRGAAWLVRSAAAFWVAVALVLALVQRGPVPALLAGDGLGRFGVVLVCLAGLAAIAILRPMAPAKEAPALVVLATLGGAVLAGANHAATVFLGLELVTLALIALIALPRSGQALEAAYKFLILGGIGAATLLFGLALGFAATGSLDLTSWGARGLMVSLGTALLLAGLAFKFALVPFHMWTPDVFSGAPAAAALLAGVTSKIGVALVLLRLDASMTDPAWRLGLAVIGAASVILGNMAALRQPSLARMLGYSSIAHSGYLALILASGAPIAPEAALFTLAAYAPALIAALTVAALLGGQPQADHLRGLLWRRPLAGAALVFALLSLAGLPVAVGFLAKFYLFTALIQSGAWGLLAIAVLGSALGLYVYGRFIVAACRRDGSDHADHEHPHHAGPLPVPTAADTVVLGLCVAAIVWFGVQPALLIDAVGLALR